MIKGVNASSPKKNADYTFPKSWRLLKSKDYQAVYKYGKVCRGSHFQVHFRQNGSGASRIGISVNRRVGKAIQRNLVKRWIRETVRTHKEIVPVGIDLVVHARGVPKELSIDRIQNELMILIKSLRRNCNS